MKSVVYIEKETGVLLRTLASLFKKSENDMLLKLLKLGINTIMHSKKPLNEKIAYLNSIAEDEEVFGMSLQLNAWEKMDQLKEVPKCLPDQRLFIEKISKEEYENYHRSMEMTSAVFITTEKTEAIQQISEKTLIPNALVLNMLIDLGLTLAYCNNIEDQEMRKEFLYSFSNAAKKESAIKEFLNGVDSVVQSGTVRSIPLPAK